MTGFSQGNNYLLSQLASGFFTVSSNKDQILIFNITTQTVVATLTAASPPAAVAVATATIAPQAADKEAKA